MSDVTKAFGERLKEIREAANMNQAEMAEKLGVSRGAISYYENGERTPDIAFLEKVQYIFDLPYEFLLGHTENAHSDFALGYEAFGLTDSALSQMEANNTIGHIISSFLEHENFQSLMRLIENVISQSYLLDQTSLLYDPKAKPLSARKFDYISYLMSDAIKTILFDIIKKDYDCKIPSEVITKPISQNIKYIDKELDDMGLKVLEMVKQHEERHEAWLLENRKKLDEAAEMRKRVHIAFGDLNYPR
ncbi:helix-turn-helix transcriptional regulator [Lachnospiraceae bacterium 54-53]